jgi:hypothetical protein
MWRRYPRELLVLLLVASGALTVINPPNVQDITRIGLSRSLAEHGSVNIDAYHRLTTDRAFRDGHWYSEKAPGLSLLAIPTVEALRAFDSLTGDTSRLPIWKRVGHIWLIRILTSGIALLAATFLVGRAAEGLRQGYGAVVAITFALGTIVAPLGPTAFDQDAVAALGFAAFVVATRRRRLLPLAGLLAGLAVVFEYQGALIALVVGVFVLVRYGWRRLLFYCAGGVPAAIGLGVYNWAAFGSPFHLSYRYVANVYTERQREGFFGIGAPSWHGAWFLFLDGKGLLLISPVLVAAAAGLVLLWRRGRRAEAGVCIAVTVLFLFADMGYFDPYGGLSPGPRFFAPALPFLALGLVEAYRRWPIPTGLLALWSLSWTTFDAISWAINVRIYIRFVPAFIPNTIWARAPLIGTEAGVFCVLIAVGLAAAYGGYELFRASRLPATA